MNYTKVGIDASKDKLVCAYRMNGVGEVRMVTLANRQEAVKPWIEKLQTQGIVQVCYEASFGHLGARRHPKYLNALAAAGQTAGTRAGIHS
jgi:hypothetical protein